MKFMIRDLLLLTVIVAVGLGWFLRERHLRAEVDRALEWRKRAGALEYCLKKDGWKVTWNLAESEVALGWPANGFVGQRDYERYETILPTDWYEPSANE